MANRHMLLTAILIRYSPSDLATQIDGGGNSDGSSGTGGGGSSDSGNFDGNSGDSRDSRFNGDSRDSLSNSGGGGRGSGEQIPGECSHSENGESYSDSRLG